MPEKSDFRKTPSFFRWLNYPFYCPNFSIVFRLLLVAQLTAAIWSPISDCDEVFNFWEPTHYLEFGRGLQTWEYSPIYAIRSWAYLLPPAIVGHIGTYAMFAYSKLQGFYAVRLGLAIFTAFAEATLVKSLNDNFSSKIASGTMLSLLISTGMWSAGTAFLPSSFTMCTTALAVACGLEPVSFRSVFWTLFMFAVGGVWGWPFAAALAVPFVTFILLHENRLPFMRRFNWILGSALLIIGLVVLPLVAIDFVFYRKLVVVPWNIVSYNVFSEHGPDLYGTEPFYFYLFNGVLNWNLQFVAAIVGSFAALGLARSVSSSLNVENLPSAASMQRFVSLVCSPLLLWLAIFTLQPHKEERFLFPVYTLIAVNSSFLFLFIYSNWTALRRFVVAAAICSAIFSLMRTTALSRYYGAPLKLYNSAFELLSDTDTPAVVCVGDEWYRFPSSYFLPGQATLGFVETAFDGILPGYFAEAELLSNSSLLDKRPGTYLVPRAMNNLNKKEPSHLTLCSKCSYFVAMVDPGAPLELCYALLAKRLICYPFLDTEKTGRLARILYFPEYLGALSISISDYIEPLLSKDLQGVYMFIRDQFKVRYKDYCFFKV